MDLVPEWRPVVGFEGRYEVSSDGRVRGLDRLDRHGRRVNGRLLKGRPNPKTGYIIVSLYAGRGWDGYRVAYIHRLVAEAYIPNPDGLPEVNHKDLNRANNRVSNLEWVTTAQNGEHRRKAKPIAYATGEQVHTTKLTPAGVREIRAAAERGESFRSIARRYGLEHTTVSAVVYRRTWQHVA